MIRVLRKPALLLLGGFLFGLLSGCSQVPLQSHSLKKNPPESLGQTVELEQVPFNPQQEYQCGPAALATVLQWNQIQVESADLVSQVYLPQRRGSLQIEMIAAVRQHDLVPYVIDTQMSTLLTELQAHNPVLVMQNLGLDWLPQWHYAIVIGYDIEKDKIILRSGTIQRHTNSFDLFERTWQRANYWGLVVVPPDTLPASATPFTWLKSVAPFEELGKGDIAKLAYQTALIRWPEEQSLLMALANVQYMGQEFSQAADLYKQVIRKKPDYAPALNNLALTLVELGQLDEAEIYAQQAIAVGGRFTSQYKDTLRQINDKKSQIN